MAGKDFRMASKLIVTFTGSVTVQHVLDKDQRVTAFNFFGEKDNLHVSDGYHSMDDLYEHRMALTAALTNMINFEGGLTTFKARQHYDGTMFEGQFIVVIVTPEGQISYHYDLKDWDNFKIPEFEKSPIPYDGHGANEVIKRLLKI